MQPEVETCLTAARRSRDCMSGVEVATAPAHGPLRPLRMGQAVQCNAAVIALQHYGIEARAAAVRHGCVHGLSNQQPCQLW